MNDFELSAVPAAGTEEAGRSEGGGFAEPMRYRERRAAEAARLDGGGEASRTGGGGSRPDHTRSRIERLEAEVAGLRGAARSATMGRETPAADYAAREARAADAAFRRQRAAADAAAWGRTGLRQDAVAPAWQTGAHPAGRAASASGAGGLPPNGPAAPYPQAVRPAGRRWGTLPGPMHRPAAAAADGWPAGAYAPAGRGPGPLGMPPDAVAAVAARPGMMRSGPWQGAPAAAARGFAPSPRDAWRPAAGIDAGIAPAPGAGAVHPSPPVADPAALRRGPADRGTAARDGLADALRPAPAEAQRHGERVRAYAAKQDHARTELPDYDRVVGAARIPVSHALAEALVESDHTARLEYHLARSPEKLAELNRLPPREAARAVGRLEAEIAGAAAPRPTRAPAPLTPLRGGAAGPMRSLAELAQSEDAAGYIELRRAQRRA